MTKYFFYSADDFRMGMEDKVGFSWWEPILNLENRYAFLYSEEVYEVTGCRLVTLFSATDKRDGAAVEIRGDMTTVMEIVAELGFKPIKLTTIYGKPSLMMGR